MAFKIDITDEFGQVTSHWVMAAVNHLLDAEKQIVTVIGYKNKAAKIAGKRGIVQMHNIEGAAYQRNMTMNEIEAAIMLMPPFAGAIED